MNQIDGHFYLGSLATDHECKRYFSFAHTHRIVLILLLSIILLKPPTVNAEVPQKEIPLGLITGISVFLGLNLIYHYLNTPNVERSSHEDTLSSTQDDSEDSLYKASLPEPIFHYFTLSDGTVCHSKSIKYSNPFSKLYFICDNGRAVKYYKQFETHVALYQDGKTVLSLRRIDTVSRDLESIIQHQSGVEVFSSYQDSIHSNDWKGKITSSGSHRVKVSYLDILTPAIEYLATGHYLGINMFSDDPLQLISKKRIGKADGENAITYPGVLSLTADEGIALNIYRGKSLLMSMNMAENHSSSFAVYYIESSNSPFYLFDHNSPRLRACNKQYPGFPEYGPVRAVERKRRILIQGFHNNAGYLPEITDLADFNNCIDAFIKNRVSIKMIQATHDNIENWSFPWSSDPYEIPPKKDVIERRAYPLGPLLHWWFDENKY